MPDDVAKWLEELGLGEYAAAFAENAIDGDVLTDLTEADLEKVGVKLGHRKKLLRAIAVLTDGNPTAPVQSSGEPTRQTHDLDENLAAWERHPGERKPVTMLFADITGSTGLTEKLDAEETHDLLYGATQRMCEAVEDNRGTVCRFMGDGVMAMFGAPVANEHHAVDACEAALEMQQAIRDYAKDIEARHGSGLQIRVGVHSGEVVVLTVGDGDKVEYDASGPTVPIAARMEQAAEPSEVYLTAATRSLAAGRIEATPLEPIRVKGITGKLPAFSLVRVKSAEESVSDSTGTHFVGRRAELSQFRSMLDTCIEDHQGQTIIVRGEPGIGKTRLVSEFLRMAESKGLTCHRGLVLPFGVGKGEDAIHALVRGLLGIPPGAGKDARARAVDSALNDGTLEPEQRVYLNNLLDSPQPTELRSLYEAMDPATRDKGRQAVVAKLVNSNSQEKALLAVVEDVHWADPTTLVHLAVLTRVVSNCAALLVMTSRIEGDPLDQTWRSSTEDCPLATMDLAPLRKQESIEFIKQFIDPGDPLAEYCLKRAAGNPLFLEQLLRSAEGGRVDSLPDSIQSLVVARLDRLSPPDKRALQTASAIGQQFEMNLLNHLLGAADYDCEELIQHNLVRAEGSGYLFAHALVQEGVYGSLLKTQRQALHKRCAEWFAETDSALKAEHLGLAGDPGAAEAYLFAAREKAQQYRFDQALRLANRGLALVGNRTLRHQLKCLKGNILHELDNVESSIAAFTEALEDASDEHERCEAQMGLAAGMRVKTDFESALAYLDSAEPIAVRHNLTAQLSRLHHLRGNVYFAVGKIGGCGAEHQLALDYARRAGSLEDEARAFGGLADAANARGRMRSAYESFRLCVDRCREIGLGRVEVANKSQMANTFIYLAAMDEVLKAHLEAVEAASRVGHRRAEMNALAGVCTDAGELANPELLRNYVERAMPLAKELQARAWESSYLGHSGWAHYLSGDTARAEELLKEALANEVARPFFGGYQFGRLSVATNDAEIRTWALREGELLLHKGARGLNHLQFYRHAMDACWKSGMWDELERYAQALEEYTNAEPLPWSNFFIARGRALARVGRGGHDASNVHRLRELIEEATNMSYNAAIPSLQEALSQLKQ